MWYDVCNRATGTCTCGVLYKMFCLCVQIVIVVQMSSEYHGSDVGYIALGGLLIGTQLNPIVHAMVQRSVRRSFQNAVRALCCGSCG